MQLYQVSVCFYWKRKEEAPDVMEKEPKLSVCRIQIALHHSKTWVNQEIRAQLNVWDALTFARPIKGG